MPLLPVVSGEEAVAAFERLGWRYVRRKSSHMILTKAGFFGALSIPDDKELKPGTLRSLIKTAGISIEGFVRVLEDS
jgi:predicted RNA binding protein YcfA (HicA-like mRNA interferase family)